MTHPDFQSQLDRLTDLPSGDADDWKERYAPIIDEVVDHSRPDDPLVSVIVVGWQSAEFIDQSLRSVDAQEGFDAGDIELIVVDNGGLEPARGLIERHADLEVRMKGNARLCRARNTGVAYAGGEFVAFVDDDGVLRPDYLERALDYFDDETVAGVRTRIAHKDHPFFTAFALHYDRGADPMEDCLVTEGSSVLRRDRYIAARGFAESLAGHEGIDLTFRLKQVDPDWRILYIPDAVMEHDYFDDWGHFIDKSFRYSDIEAKVIEERPEIEEFLYDYLDRDFPLPRQTPLQMAVRLLLTGARFVAGQAARIAK